MKNVGENEKVLFILMMKGILTSLCFGKKRSVPVSMSF
jgi:hypothetical protein